VDSLGLTCAAAADDGGFAAKAIFAKQSQMKFFQQLSSQWVVKKWSFENETKTKPNATGSNRGGAMIRGGLNPKNRSWADRNSDMRREPGAPTCVASHVSASRATSIFGFMRT